MLHDDSWSNPNDMSRPLDPIEEDENDIDMGGEIVNMNRRRSTGRFA